LLFAATAKFRNLSGWQLAVPLLWLLYILGLLLSSFNSDETLLYPHYGIDGGFLADVVIGFAFVLMGLTLWSKEQI
jgi:hypothetical protein